MLHRDGLMLVIDKPAGLPVHRGPKGGANLESSFDALRFGLPRPPVLAHRLDHDTSGCLVLGRHRKATASLGLLFKHGKISKTYWAVVEGGPAEDEGTIDMPLGRLNAERGWWQKPDPDGQKAVTNWKVLGRGDGLAWLALEPVTGRTHQLRVHTSAMGWPIVGDNIYGNGPRFGEPLLHLHSREIVIPISKNKEPVRVVAPAPAHMHERLRRAGGTGSSGARSLPSPLVGEGGHRAKRDETDEGSQYSAERTPHPARLRGVTCLPSSGEKGRVTPSAARHHAPRSPAPAPRPASRPRSPPAGNARCGPACALSIST